jgi:hypothetical protein
MVDQERNEKRTWMAWNSNTPAPFRQSLSSAQNVMVVTLSS